MGKTRGDSAGLYGIEQGFLWNFVENLILFTGNLLECPDKAIYLQ